MVLYRIDEFDAHWTSSRMRENKLGCWNEDLSDK